MDKIKGTMKKQDERFKMHRKALRHFLVVRRLNIKSQTYLKLMNQKVNGVKDGDLQDWEVNDINNSLDKVIKVIQDFKANLNE